MIAQRTLAFLLLGLLLALGAAEAQAPRSPTGSPVQPSVPIGENGMDTSFARISTDARPAYEGPATPIEAEVVIKNSSRVAQAHILMLGFNGLSESVQIEMDDAETRRGFPLRVSQDNRTDSARQPKVWIKPSDAPTDEPILLKGRVTANANGQFHVGVIVIAFTSDYQKFVTPQNEYAEVYAFGLLAAIDADEDGAPFQGQGNVPGPTIMLALLALVTTACVCRRSRSGR